MFSYKSIILFTFVIIVSGCTVVTIEDRQYIKKDNLIIKASILDDIIVNRTSVKWLYNHLGKPDNIINKSDHILYQYVLTQEKISEKNVLFVYKKKAKNTEHFILNLQINGDQVTEMWQSQALSH